MKLFMLFFLSYCWFPDAFNSWLKKNAAREKDFPWQHSRRYYIMPILEELEEPDCIGIDPDEVPPL